MQITKLQDKNLLSRCNVVDMIAKCNKEVKEKRSSAVVHFQLHGAAPFERVAGANNKSEVVCTQLGVCIWGVGICVAGRRQDGAALNAGFCQEACKLQLSRFSLNPRFFLLLLTKTLLAEGNLLEL